MRTDPTQSYILKSEHNLAIASAVADAWIDVRQNVVTSFLSRLDSRLKRKLKGWDSESWGGHFFTNAYAGYSIWKPAWEYHSIGLQCGEHGDSMVIGVCRSTNNTRKVRLHPPLLSAVQRLLPSATSTAWWEARTALRSPAPDWRKPEVLWRMHTDKEFLEEVAEQILEIAIIAAPILDTLYRKK